MSSSLTRRISPTSASAKAHAAFLSSRESRESARAELPSCGAGLGRGTAADGSRYAPAAAQPGAEARPSPLSLTPIRFALPITAFRDGAPSARAMTLALLPSSASLLRTSIASSVHSISTAPCPAAARAGARWNDPERAYSIRRRSRGRCAVTTRPLMMKSLLILVSCLEIAVAQFHISNCPARVAYTVCLRRGANALKSYSERKGDRHVRRRFG